MVAGGTCFAAMSALIRPAATLLHPLEVVFIRVVFGGLFMLPLLLRSGRVIPPKGVRATAMVRAGADAISMALWFVAIPVMPLATAIALNFTMPLFVTIFAVLALGEVVRARRWSAIAVGFLGALIILKPFGHPIEIEALFVLVSAAVAGGARIGVRIMLRQIGPNEIVAYHFLLLIPCLLVPALFVWRWPDAEALVLIAGLAAVGSLGHWCVAKALAVAEVSALAPFDYMQLVASAAIGYVAFGEVPGPSTWIGAVVIAGAAVYIARREAALRREAGESAPKR
ncbi:MAG: DMT family transporter [Alphaproteobacteria bacterium]